MRGVTHVTEAYGHRFLNLNYHLSNLQLKQNFSEKEDIRKAKFESDQLVIGAVEVLNLQVHLFQSSKLFIATPVFIVMNDAR